MFTWKWTSSATEACMLETKGGISFCSVLFVDMLHLITFYSRGIPYFFFIEIGLLFPYKRFKGQILPFLFPVSDREDIHAWSKGAWLETSFLALWHQKQKDEWNTGGCGGEGWGCVPQQGGWGYFHQETAGTSCSVTNAPCPSLPFLTDSVGFQNSIILELASNYLTCHHRYVSIFCSIGICIRVYIWKNHVHNYTPTRIGVRRPPGSYQ